MNFFAATVIAVILIVISPSLALNDVVIRDLKLYVDGEEFIIKGMCYHPSPLGMATMDQTTFLGGTGLCSVKRTPYGEWLSACFDSDFFDGSPDAPNRFPPGPASWFRPVWERDFPVLKELGVNTIRIYNTNPTTRQASQQNPSIVPEPYGKDHTQFMDYAQQNGLKVIFPLVGDYTILMNTAEKDYLQLLKWQIDEVGGHPALLMWNYGNELPIQNNLDLVSKLNHYMDFIRGYTQFRWNRTVPITNAVVDLPDSYNFLAEHLNVDVFTSNAGYRGWDYSDLWTGGTPADFPGWKVLSCMYKKPLFIGEFGWLGENNAPNTENPNWFNSKLKSMLTNIDNGCVGGAMFEYSDEPLKADPMQKTLGVISLQAKTVGTQSSLMEDAFIADDFTRKPILFDNVKAGQWQGQDCNYNTDFFTVLGRPQTKLTDPPGNICAGVVKQCPGNPPCSGNGQCDMTTDPPTCKCNAGFRGASCWEKFCPGNYFPCTGYGTCDLTQTPPVCNCQAGHSGAGCEISSTPNTNPGFPTTGVGTGLPPNPGSTGTGTTSHPISQANAVPIFLSIFCVIWFTVLFVHWKW